MAILTGILSLILRQLTSILQAIFGWSITALFGKLPRRSQTALSIALILSSAWPLLLVGCVEPSAAAWALAFLPLHRYLGPAALRVVWIALAVLVPLGVGGITRVITPSSKLHGGVARTLLGGPVMAVGYFLAFLVTAITVPVVKVLSAIRRWDDCHVYVQPREGRYDAVLKALVEACGRGDARVVQEAVPRPMALANTIVQRLARPFVVPVVATNPQRLRGEQLELYLYAADLLLRGEPHVIAHVRAAMTRTDLEVEAYTVESPEAQALQDELRHLWRGTRDRLGPREADPRARLGELSHRLDRAPIAFEEWTTLEQSLRRLERAASGAPDVLEAGSDHAA